MSVFKRLHYNAPVILTYTLLSLLATALIAADVGAHTVFSVYRSPLSPLFVVRLFAHVLGHASVEHFTGNFMLILLIGPMLEEKYGSRTILIVIAITAFVTGITNILMFSSMLMGASGVAFSFIIISSLVNLREGRIPLTFVLVVALYIGREVAAALAVTETNISHTTHILGGLCGAVMGSFLARKDSSLRSE